MHDLLIIYQESGLRNAGPNFDLNVIAQHHFDSKWRPRANGEDFQGQIMKELRPGRKFFCFFHFRSKKKSRISMEI